MTLTLEAIPDRAVRAETCPKCGGVLTTNQDGWKTCHTCGYSSPGYAPHTADADSVARTR
jgi:uncharacterized Zn finger protein (UPF0148 family)